MGLTIPTPYSSMRADDCFLMVSSSSVVGVVLVLVGEVGGHF